MRKFFFVLVCVFMLASFIAYAAGDKVRDTAAAKGKIKVGLVTDVGKVDDKTFNQFAYEGMMRAAEEFGFEANYIETQQPTDYEKNIQTFTEEGYDVIVTVGFMIQDATYKMAQQYPDIAFIGVDQAYDPPIDNALGLLFAEDQAGFVAGALAGLTLVIG